MAVALYARVSTVKQAEKDLSIPDQLKQMRDWCKARGYAVAVEYIEPGASGTDDRRPIFRQMMSEATRDPAPFEAVIVHSLSRFFRDSLEFALHERTLGKFGAKVISITQQTSDDPAGGMARSIFTLFDEYQSKENGKHTLRAMQENARQGFSNGSRPTFGYCTVETETIGNKGKKRRFDIDPVEAEVVRRVFSMYLEGLNGEDMGSMRIASYLNERGLRFRRQPWTRSRVLEVLNNRTYIGEFVFNKRGKDGKLKPESDWITVAVPAIIDEGTFGRVHTRLAARAPARCAPRMVNNPTLLTGLLKCGGCGAGMTLMTGKGGRYRYYKCQTRIAQNNGACDNPSIPMEKLDRLVLEALAERVFAPSRVKGLLSKLRSAVKASRTDEDSRIGTISKEIQELERGSERLYEAVEKGLLPLDETLQARAQKIKARREAALIELSGLRRGQAIPASLLSQNRLVAFCQALKTKLLGDNKSFAKRYLRLLVSEIRLTAEAVTICGGYAALAVAAGNENGHALARVPTFEPNWLPDLGSNQGPAD